MHYISAPFFGRTRRDFKDSYTEICGTGKLLNVHFYHYDQRQISWRSIPPYTDRDILERY